MRLSLTVRAELVSFGTVAASETCYLEAAMLVKALRDLRS